MKFKWFRDRSQSSLDAYLQTLKLYEWVQPEPIRLKSQEDFVRVFSRNLIGTWSNDEAMMPNPMSRDVRFREDGTGFVSGVFFTEYSGEFEWREKGERLLEVRSTDEAADWVTLSWSFGEPNSIWLDPEESDSEDEDDPEGERSALIDSLISDPLILSDGRSWVESENEDEIPSDAEEVEVDGRAAWLSKGDTYWELRQGPYKVTVANVDEEGKESHFFSVGFVIPETRKRYTGYFDHASGHVDREAFLNVAGRIAVGLRKTYG